MGKRILLVNKFYYRRGGDCVCVLNLERLLRKNGHEVAIFAMDYPENDPTPWSRYFAANVTFQGTASEKLKMVRRTLGWDDINKSFSKILHDFKPDVVHLHNIHSYLSPGIAKAAKDYGATVVWTLHDYKLLCPSYLCLRNGSTCEKCLSHPVNVLLHRCMKGSLPASAVAWMEAVRWNKKNLQRRVDTFISPSRFLADLMKKGGFSPDKITVLPNFLDSKTITRDPSHPRQDYYCYVGRLSEEKGVRTLLKVAATMDKEIRIAGDGPLLDSLKARYDGYSTIKFLGRIGPEEVNELLENARFSVVPSEWYENNPLSVIESLCAGTPVVGAQIGGIPELINDNNGLTFRSGDETDLAQAINLAWWGPWDYQSISDEAREKFSEQKYYANICKIYQV